MELIRIDPKNYWKEMMKQPRIMLLAHLAKYPEYVQEALAHPDSYKICDNSIIELGETFSIEKLVEAATSMKCDEIILPDVFKDGKATLASVYDSIEWLRSHNYLGNFKLMAVCHGKDVNEWIQTFNILNDIPEIDVIGIPKVLSTYLKSRSRMELAHIFTNTSKQIHLLGVWYSLEEIVNIPGELWYKIRSCDTCLPALYAIQNKSILEDREGTINLEKEYDELTPDRYQLVWNEYLYLTKEK